MNNAQVIKKLGPPEAMNWQEWPLNSPMTIHNPQHQARLYLVKASWLNDDGRNHR